MGTKYQGNKQQIAALNAFISLIRAGGSVSGRLNGHLSDADLTESQFGVLEALLHLGSLSLSELAGKLLVTAGNITFVVDKLEQKSLVERVRQKDDRRCIKLHLTSKGRNLIKKIFPKHAQLITEEFAVLTTTELKELHRLCKKVGLGK